MTKKITISIPDDLHKRLKGYRHVINISNVSAESLKTTMDKIDLCVLKAKRRFKILTTSESCQLAHKQGLKWAGYHASPIELAIICNWIDNEENSDLIDLLSYRFKDVQQIISGYSNVYEYIMNSSFATNDIFTNSIDYFHEDAEIANSFIDGAKIVWGQIKNETISKLMDSED
jgi:hypothetical protein